ncbi:MAG TPA: glutamine--fructose-6-phosphate transaminase (isomerizing) [Candidatus Acidoferrales bacterium]|nr:glutamine--fructose-6-phosphate transaminase (isomerizing) [Candidatus Acidoferrales bacterium]
MCGITGVVSFHPIGDRLYEGVRHLEYRGYDSCGIAFLDDHHVEIRKDIGSVDEVDSKENIRQLTAQVGIAHTRWATHGKVTKENAHPHQSCHGEFVVVHNGIIANYKRLRDELLKAGHHFRSETDTEVIAHLIEQHFAESGDVERAWVGALRALQGSYALAMISPHDPDHIYCARHEGPLIIGVGSESNYIGSDFNAFIDYTKSTVILEDGEYGIVSRDSFSVKSLQSGDVVEKTITVIPWDSELSRKGGYPHYMLKEIHEQPQAVRSALSIGDDEIAAVADMMAAARRVHLLGVGTTYYVALFGQYLMAQLADMDAPAVSSDEFRHLDRTDSHSLVLAISQSGETYDTVMSLRHAKERGAKTAAIVNVMGSSIARMVDRVILQGSGPEVCVVSTKAALVQMILLTRLAIELGTRRGTLSAAVRREHEAALAALPGQIETILNEKSGLIRAAAYRHARVQNWLFLGRGIYYPIALEASLKMKEVTYVHAEGMPGGFLKHGTLSLVDDKLYTLVVVPPPSAGELYAMTMSSVEEVKARGGFVFGITYDGEEDIFNDRLVLSPPSELTAPFLPLVAAQLLAYFTATALKRNVDKPRSLAKSVTVA